MKLCHTQEEAMSTASRGYTTIWIKDERKERKGLEDIDDDFRTGFIYSVDENILKMLAKVVAPDIQDDPFIEYPLQRLIPQNVIELLNDDGETEKMRNSAPCCMKVCGAALNNCYDFFENH